MTKSKKNNFRISRSLKPYADLRLLVRVSNYFPLSERVKPPDKNGKFGKTLNGIVRNDLHIKPILFMTIDDYEANDYQIYTEPYAVTQIDRETKFDFPTTIQAAYFIYCNYYNKYDSVYEFWYDAPKKITVKGKSKEKKKLQKAFERIDKKELIIANKNQGIVISRADLLEIKSNPSLKLNKSYGNNEIEKYINIKIKENLNSEKLSIEDLLDDFDQNSFEYLTNDEINLQKEFENFISDSNKQESLDYDKFKRKFYEYCKLLGYSNTGPNEWVHYLSDEHCERCDKIACIHP